MDNSIKQNCSDLIIDTEHPQLDIETIKMHGQHRSMHDQFLEFLNARTKFDCTEEQAASNDKHFYWNTHAAAYKLKTEIGDWLDEIDLFNDLERMTLLIDESGIEPHYIENTSGFRMAFGITFDFTKEIACRFAECIDAMCDGTADIACELREELIDVLGPDHEVVAGYEEPVTYH